MISKFHHNQFVFVELLLSISASANFKRTSSLGGGLLPSSIYNKYVGVILTVLANSLKEISFCSRFSFKKYQTNYMMSLFFYDILLILPETSKMLSRIKLKQQGTVTI